MYVNFETAGYVYILASEMGGTLYVGVTSDLLKRVSEHREGITGGFTTRYSVKRLVYWREYGAILDAIEQEKQMKKWKRAWKVRLIEEKNPHWDDLFSQLLGVPDKNVLPLSARIA